MGGFGRKTGGTNQTNNPSKDEVEKKEPLVVQPKSLNTTKGQSDLLKNFKVKAYEALMERIDLVAASQMAPDFLRHEIERFITDFTLENNVQINAKEQKQIASSLVDDMIGLGPLEDIIHDDSVTDILVNGPKNVYVERKGKLEKNTNVKFHDEAHLQQIARRIASRVGRRVDESSPMVDARLADGSRVNIIMPPLALDGTSISIRKFSRINITLDQMIESENLSKQMASSLKNCCNESP